MKNPSRLVAGVALLTALGFATGCAGQPRLKAHFVGLGDLPLQPPETPLYPDALSLLELSSDDAAAAPRPPYRLGPQDEVVVLVWGRADLGSQVPVGQDGALRASIVQEDGSIFLPFLGDVPVAAKTLDEVQQFVEQRYLRIIENPQVDVKLQTCRSQSVALEGSFARPGLGYLCPDRLTLGEILAGAGGLAPDADTSHGILVRDGFSYSLNLLEAEKGRSDAKRILLRRGDTIYLPSVNERVVYAWGEVRRQGAITIPPEGMNLLDLLSQARGVDTVTSSTRRMFLVRRTDRGVFTYKMKLSDVMQGPEIPVRDGDTLYVPPGKLEVWDRWWRKAIPITTTRADVKVQ